MIKTTPNNTGMTLEGIKQRTCPKIVLLGWWWKKYIPYYQKKSKIMNDIMMKDWVERGYYIWLEQMRNKTTSELLKNAIETHYTNEK